MGDPVSIRHVIASSDYSDRIQKAEAVQDQQQREQFAQEVLRQEELKRTRVNEGDGTTELQVREEEEKERRRREEQERRAAEQASEEEPETDEAEADADGDHIIDLRV